MSAASPGSRPTRTAWLSAATDGLAGAAGRPVGVTVAAAAVHGPSELGPIAATSHWYSVPLVSPSTTVVRSSETPSVDSIAVAAGRGRQRTL